MARRRIGSKRGDSGVEAPAAAAPGSDANGARREAGFGKGRPGKESPPAKAEAIESPAVAVMEAKPALPEAMKDVPAPEPADLDIADATPTASQDSSREPLATPLDAVDPPAMEDSPPVADAPPSDAEPAIPASPQPPLLFEVAWEVCWQLGGIYTVLKTKAPAMLERWGDRYCLIGPYNPNTAAVEFEEQPTYGSIRDTLNRLREWGLPCHFGRWLIPGRPRVILIDYRARLGSLGNDKYLLWKDHGISAPDNDGELNEVIAFGFAVAEFFRAFTQIVKDRPILAQFHEWMGGVAVPRIAHLGLPVATVFTTHATLLGRYLAGDNPYFYDHLTFFDADAEAKKYQIFTRHSIEKAAAHAAVVFTTVSEVTGIEAEKLLGRQSDVIVPNGLNIQRFAAPHEFQHLHATYKEKIHEFVMGHFFPSYTFDLDNTVYLFTAGRYEYRNKGFDMYIEALARLNHRLKELPNPPTVVAFIVTRAPVRHLNVDVLRNQTMFEDLRKTCGDIERQMGQRLFNSVATGRIPGFGELMPDEAQVKLKRSMHAWRTWRQPLIVTHDLVDDVGDPTLKRLRECRLFNAAEDPVKVIFHPEFVSATSPTISLDYEQFVRGCHVGIFPSYYEPWGYTPMECVALGLPAVTTDLSGFGVYVQRHVPELQGRRTGDFPGVCVLSRRQRSFDEATNSLVDYLLTFLQLTRRQRIEYRNRVERLGELFDWSILAKHYDEAHKLALDRVSSRLGMGKLELRFA